MFIDEIDKLKDLGSQRGQARVTSGEGVQHALLKIMEGAPVKIKNMQYIDTTQILFICGGAFVGLDEILSKTHSFGFISTSEDDNQKLLNRLNTRVKPEYRVGARSLRGIFEEMLTPVIYLVPDHPEVRQVKIASLFENPRFIGTRSFE